MKPSELQHHTGPVLSLRVGLNQDRGYNPNSVTAELAIAIVPEADVFEIARVVSMAYDDLEQTLVGRGLATREPITGRGRR